MAFTWDCQRKAPCCEEETIAASQDTAGTSSNNRNDFEGRGWPEEEASATTFRSV